MLVESHKTNLSVFFYEIKHGNPVILPGFTGSIQKPMDQLKYHLMEHLSCLLVARFWPVTMDMTMIEAAK